MNYIVSTFIGTLIAIMVMINGTLSNAVGNYTANVIIHVIGLIGVILVLLFSRTTIKISKGIPLYLYSAGAIGVFTVLFNNMSFSALGVSLTLALGLLGQSISSIFIDHFGLLQMSVNRFNTKKTIGLMLIILGIIVMTIF